MKKMRLYSLLGLILSLSGLSSQAQSLTNTATTITLTNTCLSVPSGSYTLTLNYVDEDNGPTGDVEYSVTVSDSSSVLVITIPGASLPTTAVNGWDLNATEGKIQLSSSTDGGILFFFEGDFNCTPLGISNAIGKTRSMDRYRSRVLLRTIFQFYIG